MSKIETSCERFERIIRRDTPPEEEEIDFLVEHQEFCPLGIHTIEALEKFHGLPPGTLSDPTIKELPPPPPGHYKRLLRIMEAIIMARDETKH